VPIVPIVVAVLIAAKAIVPHYVAGVVYEGSSSIPVRGAVIADGGGKRLGVTDRGGRFRVPAADGLHELRVAAPHLASKTVRLPAAGGDVDLGKIGLWRSAKVTFSLTPISAAGKLRWSIGRAEPGATKLEVLRNSVIDRGRPQLVVDDLEPSHYLFVIEGEQPLQKFATPVALEAGDDLTIPVTITPSVVDIAVLMGDKALPYAAVQFQHATFLWDGTVRCDDQGKATAEIWQSGKFWVLTQSRDAFVDGRMETLSESSAHIPLEIHLPAHTVHGHVLDAATNAPLGDCNISIEVNGKGTRTTRSDGNGEFQFDAVQEGHHLVRVYKKGYRTNRATRLAIESGDGDVEQTIALSAEGATRSMRVLDHDGHPVIGADAFFGFGASVEPLERSDDSGSLTLPEGSGTLFVVPPTGSFGVRKIEADDPGPIMMTVPAGKGLLTIRSESTKHEPIPRVLFVLRVDGTLLPAAVVGRLAATQQLPFKTDADGRAQLSRLPAGRYDIWPVRTREELEQVFSGTAGAPAATAIVSSVPQMVVMTFDQQR
jgi:hypothetical protein